MARAMRGADEPRRPMRVIDPDDPDNWEVGLALKKNMQPAPTAGNAALMLAHSPEWEIRYDELSGVPVFERCADIVGMMRPRRGAFDAYHESHVRHWLSARFAGHAFAGDSVVAAIEWAAKQKRFSPIREYLEGITWDGTPRIATWLSTYMGAKTSQVIADAGRMWLISGIARAMVPGAKADHMLVLEGAQGARKTSALEALFGAHWFLDSVPDLTTKDAQVLLAGKWGACMDELHAMKSEKVTELAKNYLTRRSDKYRPPYSRHQIDQPRTVIFCGTTNQDQYLSDPTGSRRFWPVRVGMVDVEAITRDRDQLWAEALAEYMDGKQWWPTQEQSEALAGENEARQHQDEWNKRVAEYVEGRREVTVMQILIDIGFVEKDVTQREQARVGRILSELKWSRVRKRTLTGARFYAYVPPDLPAETVDEIDF